MGETSEKCERIFSVEMPSSSYLPRGTKGGMVRRAWEVRRVPVTATCHQGK